MKTVKEKIVCSELTGYLCMLNNLMARMIDVSVLQVAGLVNWSQDLLGDNVRIKFLRSSLPWLKRLKNVMRITFFLTNKDSERLVGSTNWDHRVETGTSTKCVKSKSHNTSIPNSTAGTWMMIL